MKLVPPHHAEPRWTALVLAGERPGGDLLARARGVPAKALIPIHGASMLTRVVATLLDTEGIGRIVILAQRPEILGTGENAWLAQEPRVGFERSDSGISHSIAAVAGSEAAPWPVLVTTADHPLLTSDIVAEFLRGVGEHDVSVGVVERRTVLARYPDSKRTWLRFRDGDFTGANLFALRTERATGALSVWSRVEADRKHALKLFWRFGPVLALRAITRTISLHSALRRVGAKVGLSAGLVRLSAADAAIDVDKPSDLAMAERILRDR